MTLPEGADCDKVQAKFEDGVLRISLPIEKKIAAGRRVQIEGPETGPEASRKEKRVH